MNIGLNNLYMRNAWIKERLAEIPSGLKILDAGAGELQWKKYCSHLDYVSQDVCKYDGKGDQSGLQCPGWKYPDIDIVCDIMNIPLPDNSFDAILCTEVLDHIPDPGRALRELTRLLCLGGTIIVTESFCGLTNQAPWFYYTGMSRYFYLHWLSDYNLTIEYNGNYFEWMAQEIRRLMSWENVSPVLGTMILKELETAAGNNNMSHNILCYGLLVKGVKYV